jgi:hypothetical protein
MSLVNYKDCLNKQFRKDLPGRAIAGTTLEGVIQSMQNHDSIILTRIQQDVSASW